MDLDAVAAMSRLDRFIGSYDDSPERHDIRDRVLALGQELRNVAGTAVNAAADSQVGKPSRFLGSIISLPLCSARNFDDISYAALRTRMIEPRGRCACMPCHG